MGIQAELAGNSQDATEAREEGMDPAPAPGTWFGMKPALTAWFGMKPALGTWFGMKPAPLAHGLGRSQFLVHGLAATSTRRRTPLFCTGK